MDANQIIDQLGGTVAVAKFFSVKPGAVSQWRKVGIPSSRMQTLRHSHPFLFEEDKKQP